jgi:hypothetical protein
MLDALIVFAGLCTLVVSTICGRRDWRAGRTGDLGPSASLWR